MKNLFGFFALSLGVLPFSFYKLEGPYYYRLSHKERPDKKSFETNVFMYEENTGYIVNTTAYNEEEVKEANDFFDCKIESIFPLSSFSYRFINDQPGLQLNRICKQGKRRNSIISCSNKLNSLESNCVLRNYFNYVNLLKEERDPYEYQTVKLSVQFTSPKGSLIINKEDGVDIVRCQEKLNFQKSLKHYIEECIIFNCLNISIFPHTYNHIVLKGVSPTICKIQEAKQKLLINKQKLDLLRSSNILSVYGVFKILYDHEEWSVVWGLAEDTKTRTKFHWITDIDNDLSILFKV